MGGAAPEAACLSGQTNEGTPGVINGILAHLGIDKFNRQPGQLRKDMFADEDTRSFGWAGHSGTMQRRSSEGTSVWSLRSVSALVRGVIGREPSGSGGDQGDHDWEKTESHLREGAKEGLIRQESLRSEYSSHLTHQRDGSFWSYTDPFEDPFPDDEYDSLDLHLGTPEKDADYDNSLPISDEMLTTSDPQDFVWPFSMRSRTLTPLREASHTTLSDPPDSLPSLQPPSHGQTTSAHVEMAVLSPPTSTSPTCYSPTTSRLSDPLVTSALQYSPISGPTLSPSLSARPDSWWSRLTKSPLLDRRTSITSKPLDFRDPTPVPPLGKLEETKQPPWAESSADTLALASVDEPAGHGRSLSSAHSGRTANTDSAEHLGAKYDVVQRLPSDGSSLRHVPSFGSAEITQQGMYAVNIRERSEISLTSNSPHVDPPHPTSSPASPVMTMGVEAPSKSDLTTQKRGAIVTSRVREYERKLSQESESRQILSPRNTRRREEIPSRTRPTIQYGVAPRASLFIANPDLGLVSRDA